MNIVKRPIFFLALFTFLLFFARSYSTLDPDFGWHLRMGRIILSSGIPRTDPLSYTMPSYPFVDHEWLTNILIYKVYSFWGYAGLAVIFSLLVLIVLYLMFPKNICRFSLVPFFLSAGIFITFAGIRTQVITWVFLALLLRLLLDSKLWLKWRFLVPFLFPVWANLHAGFSAGIAVLGFTVLIRSIQTKKFLWVDYSVVLLSIIATLINPYGPRLWWEVWMQISDPFLHSEIAEWIPGIFFADFAFLSLVSFTAFFTFYYLKNKQLFKSNLENQIRLMVFVALFIAALSAARHIPLWTIAAAPLLSIYLETFFNQIKDNQYSRKMSLKFYKILTVSVIILFLTEFGLGIFGSGNLNENNFYPKTAVQYLKTQNIAGNIFSVYGWGGYLDWKMPQKKVFIDGRMPSWRWDSAPANESNYAFQDYTRITKGRENFIKVFQKYHVDIVLFPAAKNPNNLTLPEKLKSWYDFFLDNLFGTKPIDLASELQKNGWKIVYQDQTAVIYQKD